MTYFFMLRVVYVLEFTLRTQNSMHEAWKVSKFHNCDTLLLGAFLQDCCFDCFMLLITVWMHVSDVSDGIRNKYCCLPAISHGLVFYLLESCSSLCLYISTIWKLMNILYAPSGFLFLSNQVRPQRTKSDSWTESPQYLFTT